ncbi:MAG: hypothetical protein M3T96_02975, partial [Acidobacteriota bacterium]|nr:hypothetical protein [Acidobacteriota bacterium]
MGKISVAAVKNHSQVENGNLLSAKKSKDVSSGISTAKHSESPTAYLEKVGYDTGKYRQISLTGKHTQILAQAKTSKVSATSSPSELLKNPRVRAMLDTIAFAEGTRGNGDYKRVVYGTVIGPANRNLPYDHSLVGKHNVLVSDLQ